MQNPRTKAEAQVQRTKLTNSYNELLEEFGSADLRSVGNYTLGRLVGKGSFGKVYLATHKLTNGSKVVLKSAKKDDPNLAREIHHHRQFLHPHIARLYEVIVTESLVWLVLEYCPGDELYNYLLRHGSLPLDKVQRIFAQLVGAVSYVHNKNCVHRDLKLENILLDKHENVKLCDFGFTREYEKMKNHLQTFCGTVCYSAPEMLRGEKYAGEKVDVWSLGIILFALLTGELPFDEDDDLATKHKILGSEPAYPDSMAADTRALIGKLLSKRPLVRPTLAEILADPFLADFAPAQHVILKLARPAPFTTALEKDTLQRMRSAGIDIDRVIENVLAQRMDALTGWWALLIEKEERKEARRERKRREKELELKALRRISAASSRLTPTLREVDEEPLGSAAAAQQQQRGRSNNRRSFQNAPGIIVPELPKLPEGAAILTPGMTPTLPPHVDNSPRSPRSPRSQSSSRQRPPVPSKDRSGLAERDARRRSRGSTLHMVTVTNSELLMPPQPGRPRRRRHPNAILNQLATLKHWITELPKRARSPGPGGGSRGGGMSRENVGGTLKAPSSKSLTPQKTRDRPGGLAGLGGIGGGAPGSSGGLSSGGDGGRGVLGSGARRDARTAPARVESPHLVAQTTVQTPRSAAAAARAWSQRQSLSPAPLTPHSSHYHRRGSAGLRGRKSTSSSVSSVRSIHHVHTHSKTSSTSSNAASSVRSGVPGSIVGAGPSKSLPRSPHSSVKVLPATPTTAGTFPAGLRVQRAGGQLPAPLNLNLTRTGLEGLAGAGFGPAGLAALGGGAMPSPGLVFAKRKKTPFRGPMLGGAGSPGYGSAASSTASRSREGSVGRRSSSLPRGAQSGRGITIAEEDEDEELEDLELLDDDDDDIEEVDAFSPVGERDIVLIEDPPISMDAAAAAYHRLDARLATDQRPALAGMEDVGEDVEGELDDHVAAGLPPKDDDPAAYRSRFSSEALRTA